MQSKILFLRHGQTDGNLKKSFNGRTNNPLNKTGRQQIIQIAPYIKQQMPMLVFSSTLQRCRDCCDIIFENDLSRVNFMDELMEIDFGIFEGKAQNELFKKFPKEMEKYSKNWQNYTIPNGEGVPDIYKRVSDFLIRIFKTYPGCNFLFIGHWGVIQSALSYLLHNSIEGFFKYNLVNGGLTTLTVNDNDYVLEELNRTNSD